MGLDSWQAIYSSAAHRVRAVMLEATHVTEVTIQVVASASRRDGGNKFNEKARSTNLSSEECTRRAIAISELVRRLTDRDDDRVLHPLPNVIGMAPERPMSTVTRSMGMSTSDQVVSRPPRRRTPIHDAGRRGSQSSSMTSTAPKALSVMVWHLGDSHRGSCEAAPATTNHR